MVARVSLENPLKKLSMAKKILTQIKLQIMGGAATPAPPVGPALGQHGLNIQNFVVKFNAATQDRRGEVVPIVITVYEDRTFDFIMKIAPASELIKKAIKLEKGSGKPLTEKVGKITKAQLREVAEKKMPDLNTTDIEAAMKIIAGTARQMGVDVEI
ncbi:MAG: 50S ribosomal protein L11 [Candidatus Uhrbacteria bacterium GW2011_GWE2_45_35]|uniref:Large ribosomal subunit protein uL11 n=1 Tax=Candidatus Uhrbacteria bacterium GW2011_GWE2_45_35 TaxID=1618993 RepID=A0A0G1MLB3_9BACT|nr:MAG: 50S ribosomal protein L11 [Candidatus Uhrbacteria bacterium GW2011_GWE2_45_35]